MTSAQTEETSQRWPKKMVAVNGLSENEKTEYFNY